MPPVSPFRETINVPIAIPAWSLFSALFIGVFIAGTLYTKMNTLIDSSVKNDAMIVIMREAQIKTDAALVTVQQQGQNHEARILNLEHSAYTPPQGIRR